MSSEINLFVTLSDGTVRKVTISDKKPIGALFETLIELEGRPVYSLFKDGVEIPRSREMIKYVPLKNGNALTEGTGAKGKNIPLSSYQNSILRSQLKRGIVSEEDVMEIMILTKDGSILVLVRKTATVDDLKTAASELLRREIKELVLQVRESGKISGTFLGWSGNIRNSLERVYMGNTPLSSLDVTDQSILNEVRLPKTIQEIEKEKRDQEERERLEKEQREEAARREEEYWRRQREESARRYEEYVRQEREAAEREARRRREQAKAAETNQKFRDWAKWAENWARQSQREREAREGAPPPIELTKEERCRRVLDAEGIKDKASFLRWALANHPDKVSANTPEEKARITEKFQVINACVDLLGIKSKKGGRRTRKGKKQNRRGRSRKN